MPSKTIDLLTSPYNSTSQHYTNKFLKGKFRMPKGSNPIKLEQQRNRFSNLSKTTQNKDRQSPFANKG